MIRIVTALLFCSVMSSVDLNWVTEYPQPPKVKVIVRIDRLKAISKDACNEKMDFKATIKVGATSKSFPVMEGNDIRPGWEFVTTSIQKWINITIEVWDDDDALCGGGDDLVIVDPGGAARISVSADPKHPETKTFTRRGKKVSGKEQAEIKFTIITEAF